MAGGNVGRVSIEADLDLSKAEKKLVQFGRTFAKSAGGIFAPSKAVADQAVKDAEKLAAAQKKLLEQREQMAKKAAARAEAGIFGDPKKGAQEIARLTGVLNQLERAFAGSGGQSRQLATALETVRQRINAIRAAHGENLVPVAPIQAAAKEVAALRARLLELQKAKFLPGTKEGDRAAEEINRIQDALEALGAETARNSNFLTRNATAINQLAFAAARAGHGFVNFLPLIARSSTLLASMSSSAGGGAAGAGGALAALRAKLTGTSAAAEGLSAAGGQAAGAMGALRGAASSAAGAIGGVGFAAIGAVAAIVAAIAIIGVLTVKLGGLGSALTKAQDSIKLIFEDAGQEMLDFARTASTAFGITEQAALRFVGKTGQLFKSFGIGAEQAGQLSRAMLITADVLRTTSTEFIESEEALQAVFDTVAGNVEGLRRFDIFLSEIGLTQIAIRNGLRVTTGAFDNVQRSLVSQIAAIETAIQRYEQYRNTQDSTQRTAERTRAAFDSIKASIGQGLAPVLSFVSNVLLGLIVGIKSIVNSISDWIKRNDGLVNGLKKIAEFAIKAFPGLNALVRAMGFLNRKGKEAAEGALDFDDALDELNDGLDEAREQFNAYKKELTVADLEQLVDAHRRLEEAVADAARAEKEALKDLARAREDAARDVEEANRDLQETIEDAEEKLFEARKKVADTEKKNFRAIRDAERALKDERLDAARRVEAAEKALADSRQKRLDAITDAQLALEEALHKGDIFAINRAQLELTRARRTDDLREAQKRLAEEEFDSKEKIRRLEEKLLETRLDAIEDLKEAERELQNVIEENAEAILDARRELHDLEVEISRRLADAMQALRDARREGKESIAQADEALDRLNFQFGTTNDTLAEILDKLERMKNALLSMPEIVGTGPADLALLNAQGRQHGGSAFARHPYIVGETGPELFIPNYSGTVVPNEELIRVLRQMMAGGAMTWGGRQSIQIPVYEAVDPLATAEAIAARLARSIVQ